jgi:hypothetical protein
MRESIIIYDIYKINTQVGSTFFPTENKTASNMQDFNIEPSLRKFN